MTTPEKAMRPFTAAKRGTLNDLKKAVEDYPEVNWRSFLFWAIGNADPTSRVEIVNWMLDHGADAAQITHHGNLNALHILFSEPKHDYSMEAKGAATTSRRRSRTSTSRRKSGGYPS